jgi:hypothetical protein
VRPRSVTTSSFPFGHWRPDDDTHEDSQHRGPGVASKNTTCNTNTHPRSAQVMRTCGFSAFPAFKTTAAPGHLILHVLNRVPYFEPTYQYIPVLSEL